MTDAPASLSPADPARRVVLRAAAALGCTVFASSGAAAAELPPAMRAVVAAFTRGAPIREGRVEMDIAELVENGNAVPLSVTVQSPMTAADHVVAIGIFNGSLISILKIHSFVITFKQFFNRHFQIDLP